MDREAWRAAIHGVAQSQTWLKRLTSSSSSSFQRLGQGIPETGQKLRLAGSWTKPVLIALPFFSGESSLFCIEWWGGPEGEFLLQAILSCVAFLQQTTPVFLPEESPGQKNLVGYSPWGCKESDTTKQLTHTLITETCSSETNTVARLKAKNGFSYVKKAMPCSLFLGTPYPIYIQCFLYF